jgi:hypothetical protein
MIERTISFSIHGLSVVGKSTLKRSINEAICTYGVLHTIYTWALTQIDVPWEIAIQSAGLALNKLRVLTLFMDDLLRPKGDGRMRTEPYNIHLGTYPN